MSCAAYFSPMLMRFSTASFPPQTMAAEELVVVELHFAHVPHTRPHASTFCFFFAIFYPVHYTIPTLTTFSLPALVFLLLFWVSPVSPPNSREMKMATWLVFLCGIQTTCVMARETINFDFARRQQNDGAPAPHPPGPPGPPGLPGPVLKSGNTSPIMTTTTSTTKLRPLAGLEGHNPTLSTFSKAVHAAALFKMLNHPGHYTLFAPNDDAFRKVPNVTARSLYFWQIQWS